MNPRTRSVLAALATGLVLGLDLSPSVSADEAQEGAVADLNSKLQELVRLPEIYIGVTFGFNTALKNLRGTDEPAPETRIAEIESTIDETAEDAPLFLELGRLYRQTGNHRQGKEALEQSIALFREQIDRDPKNDALHRGLARALLWLGEKGDKNEAEQLLRRAVALGPEEWENWFFLGRFLRSRLMDLAPEDQETQYGNLDPEGWIRYLVQWLTDPADYRQAAETLSEAEECMTQSLDLDPSNFEPYVERAVVKWLTRVVKEIHQLNLADRPLEESPVRFVFEEDVFSDLREAARRTTTHHELLQSVTLLDLLADGEPDLSQMPPDRKQFILDGIERLNELSQHDNQEIAAGALEGLALFEFVTGNREQSREAALKAIRLNPDADRAWDLALMALVAEERFQEIEELAAERIDKGDPEVFDYLVLAKAEAKQDKWDEAAESIETARRMEPGNALAKLFQAALLLKQAQGPAEFKQAQLSIMQANDLIKENAEELRDEDSYRKAIRDLIKLATIYEGMHGNEEDSLQMIERALQIDPDDSNAKAIQRVLEDGR